MTRYAQTPDWCRICKKILKCEARKRGVCDGFELKGKPIDKEDKNGQAKSKQNYSFPNRRW